MYNVFFNGSGHDFGRPSEGKARRAGVEYGGLLMHDMAGAWWMPQLNHVHSNQAKAPGKWLFAMLRILIIHT